MKTLIFIHGGESFRTDIEYQKFLQDTYVKWQSVPWSPEVKTSWKYEVAKQWHETWGVVYMPDMPDKIDAKYDEWKLIFKWILAKLVPEDEITLVGTSLGWCFLLKYFSEVSVIPGLIRDPAKKDDLIDITGFLSSQEWQVLLRIHQIHLLAACISEWDFTPPESYESLKKLWNRVHIWHADDDRVVTFWVAQQLAQTLPDAQAHFFSSEKGYGHFHGLASLPELEVALFS